MNLEGTARAERLRLTSPHSAGGGRLSGPPPWTERELLRLLEEAVFPAPLPGPRAPEVSCLVPP